MEDPTQALPCPDCDGKGHKLIIDYDQLEEQECSLCLGRGILTTSQYMSFKQECRENYLEGLVEY